MLNIWLHWEDVHVCCRCISCVFSLICIISVRVNNTFILIITHTYHCTVKKKNTYLSLFCFYALFFFFFLKKVYLIDSTRIFIITHDCHCFVFMQFIFKKVYLSCHWTVGVHTFQKIDFFVSKSYVN